MAAAPSWPIVRHPPGPAAANVVLACASPPAEGALLQIGFGDGRLLAALAARCDLRLLAGVETSGEALRRAREWLLPRRGPAALDLRLAQADALPFDDDSFDLVIALDLWDLWRDRLSVLAEIAGVLKPGGEALLALGDQPAGAAWEAVGEMRPLLHRVGLESEVRQQAHGPDSATWLVRGRKPVQTAGGPFMAGSNGPARMGHDPGRAPCVRCFSLRP